MNIERPNIEANPEASPAIEKDVDELMNDLEEIQNSDPDKGPGLAFMEAGEWLKAIHSEAMQTSNEEYRIKAWMFCSQAEDTLKLLNEGPKGNPYELSEQQQILAAMAYTQHMKGDDRYLDEYKEWLIKHRMPTDKDGKDLQLKEMRNEEEWPKNLSKYADIWNS